MRVLWLGIEDTGGCTLHWNDLRAELRDVHGVELSGPGYGWPDGPMSLSSLIRDAGTPDWIVLDDCNAKGYVPIQWDCQPDCNVAVREHDWWNRHRFSLHERMKPDVTMGCYDRPMDTRGRSRPGWTLVPQVVSTRRFHPGNGQARPYSVGFYGKTGKMYDHRTAARREIAKLPDTWLGQHGGYWHVKECNDGVHTFYNDLLADRLRQCRMAWVDSPDRFGACVMKYFEASACGCLLFGEAPFNSAAYLPDDCFVECPIEDIRAAVDYYAANEEERKSIATRAWEHVKEHHSVEARARQIMEVLRA